MNKAEFLALSVDEQLDWIEEQIDDHETLLYDADNYIGSSYPEVGISYDSSFVHLDTYSDDREGYGTVEIIQSKLPDLSEKRLNELHAGAAFNERELTALKMHLAEEDVDGWIGHHGLELKLTDDVVFAHFEGEGIGQGGFIFHYRGAYADKKTLRKYVETLPFAGTSLGHLLSIT